jgi:hypothetical protein
MISKYPRVRGADLSAAYEEAARDPEFVRQLAAITREFEVAVRDELEDDDDPGSRRSAE